MSNHIYPKLACYKREWVPVLEMAKLTLDQEYFLCIAVNEAATMCETRYGGTAWQELGAEIRDTISDSLGNCRTVIVWYRGTFSESISKRKSQSERSEDYKAYRLAWIDHIIAECKDA